MKKITFLILLALLTINAKAFASDNGSLVEALNKNLKEYKTENAIEIRDKTNTCNNTPGKRGRLEENPGNTRVCSGFTVYDIQCKDYTRPSFTNFLKRISRSGAVLWTYSGSGTSFQVGHSCGSFAVSWTEPFDFNDSNGNTVARKQTTITCQGVMDIKDRFNAVCTNNDLAYCYSNGNCVAVGYSFTISGQFRD